MDLASVVRMERDDLPRIPAETRLQGSDHIDLCFRPDRSCLRPSRGAVRDGQGPVEIFHCLSSIMTHQVHGQGTRDIQGRVHTGLDGNPSSQGSAPGMGDAMEAVLPALPCQESPDRGRTHLEEERSCLIIDMEMPMGDEVLHKEEHASCQTDRTQERAGCPDGDECLLAQRAVPGRTVPVDMLRGISHEDAVSQEVPLSCLVQDTGRISPAIPRPLTEVVQHL